MPQQNPIKNPNNLRIMQSYIYNRPDKPHDPSDPCRAMMEVIKQESGRWVVSKLATEHAHPLPPPPGPAAPLAPAAGMEFDSVSMARDFYGEYGARMGFGVRAGCGRRSRGSRMLVMQRFSCTAGRRGRGCDAGDSVEGMGGLDGEKMCGLGCDSGDDGAGGMMVRARALREFGIRGSRYSREERRDIILRYMRKRNSRQGVDRSVKVMIFFSFHVICSVEVRIMMSILFV